MFAGRRWAILAMYMLTLGMVIQLSGCADTKQYGAVHFKSMPQGAEVVNLKDDATLGMTPVVVTWEGKEGEPEYVTVEFVKKGYFREITSFWVNTRHDDREAAAAEPQPVSVELEQRK